MDSAEILCEYTKSVLYRVPQVLRRYLHSFLSYSESLLGGGALYAPPPNGGLSHAASLPSNGLRRLGFELMSPGHESDTLSATPPRRAP